MKAVIAEQIARLQDMTLAELRETYQQAFGEATTSRHKAFLQERIAWRLQANEYGNLSERALRRAEDLANDADLRMLAPKADRGDAIGRTVLGRITPKHDKRIPMPGAVLVRAYQGRTVIVTVLDKGFLYEETLYKSLTAVAKAITGSHWNGLLFFGLTGNGTKR